MWCGCHLTVPSVFRFLAEISWPGFGWLYCNEPFWPAYLCSLPLLQVAVNSCQLRSGGMRRSTGCGKILQILSVHVISCHQDPSSRWSFVMTSVPWSFSAGWMWLTSHVDQKWSEQSSSKIVARCHPRREWSSKVPVSRSTYRSTIGAPMGPVAFQPQQLPDIPW